MDKIINVTAAIIEREQKILIARRKEGTHMAGYWEFPGGKIESGETPEECLERELAEEFGIETSVGEFMAESIFKYPGKTIRLLGYKTRYLSGDFVLNAHSEIKWVSQEEMDKFEFAPADLPLVEALRKMNSKE